jgi:hypothetical protein
MDNTMDIKLNSENNPMISLSFTWVAIFSDNTKIEQFENGIENKFQLVKDKFDKLAYFNLTDKKGHMFTIDLINGRIGYNYLLLPYLEKTNKQNVRLIFFRRHRVEIGTQDLKEKFHKITYHLGFQYLKDGKNQKIILQIDEQGNWVLGDN